MVYVLIMRILACCSLLLLGASCSTTSPSAHHSGYAETYANIAFSSYSDSLSTAKTMQKAIDIFVGNPTDANLAKAKQAWVLAREAYGPSEAFRFYQGPIDFVDEETGQRGPESRLNGWPIDAAQIDYVRGHPIGGIVNDTSVAITREVLVSRHATGYHAIEFLLWGEDFHPDGPGRRPVSDYAPGVGNNDRRHQVLVEVTRLLVRDLHFLAASWKPDDPQNYRALFLAKPPEKIHAHIVTGLATLSTTLADDISAALESGEEQSRFADNTHRDIILNSKGIFSICHGGYGRVFGTGLLTLIENDDEALADKLKAQLATTKTLAESLPVPFDRILVQVADSPGRKQLKALVQSLQAQADLLVKVGESLPQ